VPRAGFLFYVAEMEAVTAVRAVVGRGFIAPSVRRKLFGAMNLRPTAIVLGTAGGRSCRAQLQRAISPAETIRRDESAPYGSNANGVAR